MNLLFTVNDAYVPWLSVLLTSLFASNSQSKFNIYVISIDITPESEDILEHQVRAAGSKLHVIKVDEEALRDLTSVTSQSASGLNINFSLRLILDKVLPEDIDTIAYLDTDMIVNGDISGLQNVTFDDSEGIGAVRDVFRIGDYSRLGFDYRKDGYFNSGFLVINLPFWRAHNVGQQCIDYLLAHPESPMPDQDALNVILRGHVKYLHPRYNCLTLFCARDEELRKRVLPQHLDEVRHAAADPAIVHYVFVNKPWFRGGKLPYKRVWRKYLELSPYSGKSLKWRGGYKGMLRLCVSSTLGTLGVKRFKSIF